MQNKDQIGVSATTKTFRVCYTQEATTFLFATPVPDIQQFSCTDRLYDYPQFFNALTLQPRKIQCPANCLDGKIFGDKLYTVDSVACTAAAHGTSKNGGVFEITLGHHPEITKYPSRPYPVVIDSDPAHIIIINVTSSEYLHVYPTSFSVAVVES